MPRRGKTPRRLEIKFRVRPLVRMPKSEMFRKLKEFVETGIVPDDIDVAYMEYQHAHGRRFSAGERIQPHEQEELAKFYAVMTAIQPEDMTVEHREGKYKKNPTVRFERPV